MFSFLFKKKNNNNILTFNMQMCYKGYSCIVNLMANLHLII